MDQGDFNDPDEPSGTNSSTYSKPVFDPVYPVFLFSLSEIYFMEAEAMVRFGVDDYDAAKEKYEMGIEAAFYRYGFENAKDFYAAGAPYEFPSEGVDMEEYIKVIALQKWVALVNFQGLEAFFEHNRTPYPIETNKNWDNLENDTTKFTVSVNNVTSGRFPRRLIYYILIIPIMFLFQHCEPDHETVEVSKVSPLPVFEYYGGQFVSYVKGAIDVYEDPGVVARVGDNEVRWARFAPNVISGDEADVYVIFYFAENEDGLISEGRRIVAFTHEDVSTNDLTGKYLTSTSYGWPAVEAKVKKLNNKGWYSCTDVLGFPDLEIKGEFVDIGRGELYLLPGKSFLGDYDLDEGRYTFTSLSWSVILTEEPYTGIEIPVVLLKSDE